MVTVGMSVAVKTGEGVTPGLGAAVSVAVGNNGARVAITVEVGLELTGAVGAERVGVDAQALVNAIKKHTTDKRVFLVIMGLLYFYLLTEATGSVTMCSPKER